MLECMKCFLNLSERKRRKKLDRIIEKGAVGEKYGPGSVVFLPNGIMNPETGKPVVTIAEYLRMLEREEAEE